MSVTANERLHSLDAVRGFALLLGVVLHTTMSFWPGEQAWIVMDEQRSEGLFLTFFVIHIFRMAIFFFLAGFFGRMVFHRYGAAKFLKSRGKRIALPLVIFWPIVMALIVAVVIWSTVKTYGWPVPPEVAAAGEAAEAARAENAIMYFPLTHLWFLYVLIWFYAIALLLRAPFAMVDRGGAARRGIDRVVGLFNRANVIPILLAIPVAAALWSNQSWFILGGVPTPDNDLVPNLQALVAYGGAFAFGWLLQRQPEQLQVWRKRWWLNTSLAIVLTIVCLLISNQLPASEPMAPSARTIGYAMCYALAMWFWIHGLTGAALAFLNRENGAIRYLADSSYWVYLMHLPLVMALQTVMMRMALPGEAKFAIIITVSMAILLATYHLLVRFTFIGWLLNGRKMLRANRKAQPAAENAQEA